MPDNGLVTGVNHSRALTPDELEQYAQAAGFSVADSKIAAAIALAESGGVPTAVNPTSGATGLWQILPSNFAQSGLTSTSAKDPQANANAAHLIFTQDGWKAWTTYGGKAYKSHLTQINGGSSSAAVNAATSAIGSAAKAVGKSITSIPDLIAAISDPNLWKRIGIGALGLLMVVFGAVVLFGSESAKGKLPPIIPV